MNYAGLANFVTEVTVQLKASQGVDPSDEKENRAPPNEVVEVTTNDGFEAECVSKVRRRLLRRRYLDTVPCREAAAKAGSGGSSKRRSGAPRADIPARIYHALLPSRKANETIPLVHRTAD